MDVLTPEETHLVLVLRTLFDHHRRAVLAFALGLSDVPADAIDHVRPLTPPQHLKH